MDHVEHTIRVVYRHSVRSGVINGGRNLSPVQMKDADKANRSAKGSVRRRAIGLHYLPLIVFALAARVSVLLLTPKEYRIRFSFSVN
jgi:hypothetical protein